jgi:hypothetical protein
LETTKNVGSPAKAPLTRLKSVHWEAKRGIKLFKKGDPFCLKSVGRVKCDSVGALTKHD